MSVFDKDTFLSTEIKGASETKYTPVPINEYGGTYIDDLGTATFKDNNGVEQPQLIITWAIPDEALAKSLGLEKVTVVDRVFLDVDPSGALLFGPNKNVKLGQIREALNLNDPKKPFNLNMLRGAGPARLKIGHRFNKQTGEGPFANIERVARG